MNMKKLVVLLFLWPMLLMAQQTSIEEILHKFDEPGNAFRGKPFWSWNGELEEEELIRLDCPLASNATPKRQILFNIEG